MSHPLTALTAAALAGIFLASGASAATHCGNRESVIVILDAQYKERVVARGISMAGQLVELFISSPGTVVGNTWTITVTNPRTKILCMISAGSSWNKLASINKAMQ
jgi:hypothetical protein